MLNINNILILEYLALKASASHVYTKQEINDNDGMYDNALNDKADKSNAYSQTEIDIKFTARNASVAALSTNLATTNTNVATQTTHLGTTTTTAATTTTNLVTLITTLADTSTKVATLTTTLGTTNTTAATTTTTTNVAI